LSGDTIWKVEDDTAPRGSTQPRGISLYGNALYASTVDDHVLSLDARTGKLLWKTEVAGAGMFTAPPLAVRGRVFQGGAGWSRKNARCYIAALDATNGKELWRFYTIPRPGEPGAKSWDGVPAELWAGAGVWSGYSYDMSTDNVLFGTGNSYAVAAMLSA